MCQLQTDMDALYKNPYPLIQFYINTARIWTVLAVRTSHAF